MALDDNIWWTRKARIQTEKRLLNNAFHAQVILLWYSIFSVFVAVYYLKYDVENDYSGIAWVVFSVLVLVMSVFINGLSFKERSGLVKESYEALNHLYHRARKPESDTVGISEEYTQLLNICENHIDRDYYFALCIEYLNHPNPNPNPNSKAKVEEGGLSKIPTKYIWFMFAVYLSRTFIFRTVLYILPIAVFIVFKCL